MNFDEQQLLLWQNLIELTNKINVKQSWLDKVLAWLQKKPKKQKSFYIYGGPGCGKTTVMKKFYQQLILPKQYHHFHAFMQKIHSNLHQIRSKNHQNNQQKEIDLALQNIVGDSKIICFDEFQVVDIVDAMLLSKIFNYFFANNIVAIITSNFHPLELYQNGLQRQLYLNFVQNIFLPNCFCYHLFSSVDYRKLKLGLKKHYLIANAKNRPKFQKIFAEVSSKKTYQTKNITVWQRNIAVKKSYGDLVLFSFKQLCCQNFSADDYRAICANFNLIFLKTVPYFYEEDVNVLRRFSLFIDEAYENKIALIVLAKTQPENLCKIANPPQYFARTVSRLQEMSSKQYWQESKFEI